MGKRTRGTGRLEESLFGRRAGRTDSPGPGCLVPGVAHLLSVEGKENHGSEQQNSFIERSRHWQQPGRDEQAERAGYPAVASKDFDRSDCANDEGGHHLHGAWLSVKSIG